MMKYIFGREWQDLYHFMNRIETWSTNVKKFIYVHNLSFEFQFLRNIFTMKNVFSRKSRKLIKCEIEEFNFEFRCTYMMTNVSLEKLSDIYSLPVKKLKGNLDYSLIRHSKSEITEKELQYCENDCLIIYEYIKKELDEYLTLKNIPLTSTGKVRKELKEQTIKDYEYRNKVRKSVNVDGNIYNLLIKAFSGGYTHANWTKADKIIKDVTSYDFTSSYPYVMTTHKFPATKFKKCSIKKYEQLLDIFAYIVVVKFKNIKCKYYNNFISLSKCSSILNGRYDNGRIISADELEIVLTDIDFKFIYNTHNFSEYEIKECYYSRYDYLPKKLIEFILEKYVNKTEFKNVDGKEVEYMLEKQKFNSIYGMSVTNNIKDDVIFDNNLGWYEKKIDNEKIEKLLLKEQKQAFLSFSYGVWVTAWARYNLLSNLVKLDNKVIYADTDSLKLENGFDKNIILDYNKNVIKKIEKVSKELNIDLYKFSPKDKKGINHTIGLFEEDSKYQEFITQGAKKYAYKNYDNSIHITVSGVPKSGAKALKKLEDFKDNFVFEHKYTNKNLIIYNDEMKEIKIKDYNNIEYVSNEKYGCCIIPTSYELNKSFEYAELISDESSNRAIYETEV